MQTITFMFAKVQKNVLLKLDHIENSKIRKSVEQNEAAHYESPHLDL